MSFTLLQVLVELENLHGTSVDSIKDVVQSSMKVPQAQQTPEEGRRTYQAKHGGNNKDEDSNPKALNDKSFLR